MKNIDADYYGYRDDDDDGILIQLEEKAEKVALLKAIEEWNEKRSTDQVNDEEDIYNSDVKVTIYTKNFVTFLTINFQDNYENPSLRERAEADPMELLGPRFTAHVPIPTQQDIENALLRKKKQELLDKYTN